MYKYLEHINGPDDLKKLSMDELAVLAYEIRKFLVTSVSKTGGHLASNLGVVELSIALHFVFDSPNDHMIWDVSHQAYVHKLLTGRMNQFDTLRQFDGLSGFTKRTESKHDKFDTGHSSTSISAGLGIAAARDLCGEKFDVVSIIGDGALTGGMAFEALNHLGHTNTNMKIILNDNAMSISQNVGGLSKALNKLRTNHMYSELKGKTKMEIGRLPGIGKPIVKWISKVKGSFKVLLVNQGMLFEDLGITYIGPVNGHDFKALIEHLEMIKMSNEPVILHVITEKGKGYQYAEIDPDKYHGVGKFNPDLPIPTVIKNDFSQCFGDQMVKLAQTNEKIVVISAAMIDGTGLSTFAKTFPKRTYDVGISEQHAVTFAAGLATKGYKPFVAIYSTFLQRAYDQILHDVCIQNLPVVFCIDRSGLVGNDGETHHGVFDIAYLNSMPNMMILSPKDDNELQSMLEYASQYQEGPIAIRYPRGTAYTLHHGSEETCYTPEELVKGERIAILATGNMVATAMNVSKQVEEDSGFIPTVVNIRKLKPLDEAFLTSILGHYEWIFTLEDHTIVGGLGDMIARLYGPKVIRLGIRDTFVPQGDTQALMRVIGLDTEGVCKSIREVLDGKGKN